MNGVARTARSRPVDGFHLVYDIVDSGPSTPDDAPTVVLLHGWPGDRGDYRLVVPAIAEWARVVVPDLRGFGDSDRHLRPPTAAYSAAAQVRSVLGLLDDLGVQAAVFGGYDIGSRLVQHLAAEAPQRILAQVLTPPLPGAGSRLLEPEAQQQFWYQQLHRLPLADELLDGRPDAVRAYLAHVWSHWGGPTFTVAANDVDRIVALYSRPGAFTASIGWYRSRRGSVASASGECAPDREDRVTIATEVLWPAHDPLFPSAWSDRLDDWYADVALTELPDAGHFIPLEAPVEFAAAVHRAIERIR